MNSPTHNPNGRGDDVSAAVEGAEIFYPRLHRSEAPPWPPFEFTLADEIDLAPRKEWLIRKYLGAGELSIVYGEPGSAKSVFATDLGFHVAAGLDWHGKTVKPGTVLYVAAERAALTKRRLAALRIRNDHAQARLAVLEARFDFFANEDHVLRLTATAREVEKRTGAPVTLIIIDTVARVIPGADENHSRDIGLFVQRIDKLRADTQSHVMLIHHSGKDKDKRMRGSTALLGAADTTIFVENTGGSRSATVDKSNDECDGEPICFELESVDLFKDENSGDTTTAPIVVPIQSQVKRTSKNTRSTLSDGVRAVFDCLHRAIDDYGVERPHMPGFPPSVLRVVDEKHWRDLVFRHTGTADESQDAKRMRFNNGVRSLISKHLVARNEEWVWPIK